MHKPGWLCRDMYADAEAGPSSNCCSWGLLLLLSFMLLACATGKSSQKSPPRDIQAHLDLASSHLTDEEPRKSLRQLLPLQDRADSYPEYHFLLGATYSAMDNCTKAIQHLEEAVRLRPDFGEAFNNLGQAQVACQEYSRAENSFQKALDLDTYLTPEYPAYNLSKLYQKQSQQKKALKFAKKAVELNWRYLPAYNQLVDIHLQRGQKEKATEWLRQAAEAFPDNVSLLFRLAENELRLGNTKKAKFWLQRILEVEKDSSTAQMARDYLDIIQD